jgi:hypothetical protein
MRPGAENGPCGAPVFPAVSMRPIMYQRAAAFCCGFRLQTGCRLGASPGYHLPPRQRSGAAPTGAERHAIFPQQNGQKQAASRAARGRLSLCLLHDRVERSQMRGCWHEDALPDHRADTPQPDEELVDIIRMSNTHRFNAASYDRFPASEWASSRFVMAFMIG